MKKLKRYISILYRMHAVLLQSSFKERSHTSGIIFLINGLPNKIDPFALQLSGNFDQYVVNFKNLTRKIMYIMYQSMGIF